MPVLHVTLPSKAVRLALAKSLGRAALAGGFLGAISYLSHHQAQDPLLFGVALAILRDLDHAAKQRGAA
jgi:hypothetical protein